MMEANFHKRLTINQILVHIKGYRKRQMARVIKDNINRNQGFKESEELDARIARDPRFKGQLNELCAKIRAKNQKFLK